MLRRGGSPGFRGFVDEHVLRVRPLFVFEGVDESSWCGTVYPVYPDEGWGASQHGDFFFWLTGDRDPDNWPVVMWPRHELKSYRFEGGMVAFLVAVLSGEHPASAWLGGPAQGRTMRSGWVRSGLGVSAGPAGR